MRIASWTCAFAVILSSTALAQGAPQGSPFAFQARTSVETSVAADNATGPRVAAELLGGGLGAVGFGFTGFFLGASSGSLAGAGGGMLGGVALGSWLGTSVAGNAMGGNGNWGGSFLGTMAGSAVSLVLVASMGNNSDAAGFLLASMIALPVIGGATGYEVSQAFNLAPPSGPLKSLTPSFSLLRDGKGARGGLVGTF